MSDNPWLREADGLRDAGFPAKAADAYRRAAEIDPAAAFIRVQLGNMLKDCGHPVEATDAYRAALERGADTADTHVQLGRALRMGGKREDALAAFCTALKADATSGDAIRELIALGESWSVQKHTRLGAGALAEAVAALDGVRCTLNRIERLLPEVASLASIPPSRWDLWRRLYQVPPAPITGGKIGLLVGLDAAPLPTVIGCLASISRQQHNGLVTGLIATETPVRKLAEQRAMLAPDRVFLVEEAVPGPAAVHAALRSPMLADADWIAIAREPLVFDREAAGWLAAAVSGADAVAAFCDEDMLCVPPIGATGNAAIYADPILKGAADPELIEQGFDFGSLILVRGDVLARELEALTLIPWPDGEIGAGWWPMLHRRIAAAGPVTHIPRVLVSRQESVKRPLIAGPVATPLPQKAGAPPLIHVIIPTLDRVDLLGTCIDRLRKTADTSEAIRITVVDNGSRETATLDYFKSGMASGWFDVLVRREPFNWSRLNNAAVAAAEIAAPILVFANNDIEMISAGWDTQLRAHLARADVGIVGARLLYPDRTIQHAGVVVGTDGGGCEHEGRNALATEPGPGGRWVTRRTVAAVTGAFLACRRADFDAVGGFDADELGVWFNDIDFCLRLRARKLRVIYEPAIEAYHHESKTVMAEFHDHSRAAQFEASAGVMRRRWGATFAHDPYFNPHYARWGTPFAWLRPPDRG